MKINLLILFFACFLTCFFAGIIPAHGEIITDGTAGPAIPLSGPDYLIRPEYGTRAGHNLFHSFSKFNLTSQESATFTGPLSVENIVTRVTDGTPSSIDGLLRSAIPGANLFFLNPAGIFLGPNASLEVDGSFAATTADYLRMGDSERFYSMPVQNEIFSSSPPTAFGFLDGTGSSNNQKDYGMIRIDGSKIESGQKTLSLIGRGIKITGGSAITVNQGRLDMASVNSAGEAVPLFSSLDTSSFSEMGDIEISESKEGRPSVLYARNGSIFIRAGHFVTDNSEILADAPFITDADEKNKKLDISAKDVEFKNNSLLSTDTFGMSDGTDIVIRGEDSIRISQSRIRAGSIGVMASGDGGTLTLQSTDITLEKGSGIESESKDLSTGNAGNVSFMATDSVCLDDSYINTFTTGVGDAGNVFMTARDIFIGNSSVISALTRGRGDAGHVNLNADFIDISNDSSARTITEGLGKAGDIIVKASDVDLSRNSSLSSESFGQNSGGDAGIISVDAGKSLRLSDGSYLTTAAKSAGGGKIIANANDIIYLTDSKITTSVKNGIKDGGDTTIGDMAAKDGPAFVILYKSQIRANADKGDGGAIFIITDNYFQSADSVVDASSKRGNDGTIRIEAPDLDIITDLTVLPASYIDASRWVKSPCSRKFAENVSRFRIARQDGVPMPIDDFLPAGFALISDFLDLPARDAVKRGEFANLVDILEKQKGDVIKWAAMALAFSAMGFYKQAFSAIQKGFRQNFCHRALLYNILGDLFLLTGHIKESIGSLKTALRMAKKSGDLRLTAGVLNNLGNLRAATGNFDGAARAYGNALDIIENTKSAGFIRARLLINMARLKAESENPDELRNIVKDAWHQIGTLPDSYQKGFCILSLCLIDHLSGACINSGLMKVQQIAVAYKNYRLLACASLFLGRFFQNNQEYDKALASLRKAIFFARQANCPDILYKCQWQMAKLYKLTGKKELAIFYYENALETLNPIRVEFFNGYRARGKIFDTHVKAPYLELSALLLEDNKNIARAMETMEFMKQAELQYLFQDECIAPEDEKNVEYNSKDYQHTALIYPILFTDHISLLISTPYGIRQVRQNVDSANMGEIIAEFREELEDGSEDFIENAGLLYDLLIRPMEKLLEDIDTLIIAPDGPLRLIPFSALYDGRNYLIEKFAVGIIPAIKLTDTAKIEKQKNRILLAGLSKTKGEFASLYKVKKELTSIKEMMGGIILFNEDFTIENFKAQLKAQPYDIIHMATHAVFGGSPDNTYLLTYDGKFTINDMDRLLSAGRAQGQGIDLLTLSACETALGDEKAAFGLAGVALKAGAKSALATLWETDDRASLHLIELFYKNMIMNNMPKVKALQEAQKELILSSDFGHPAFWASFLLIGNWL